MNYQSIKKKLLRFKSIFTAHWPAFMASHPRYDTDYYQAEIAKMLNCGSETKVAKVKPVCNAVNAMLEIAW